MGFLGLEIFHLKILYKSLVFPVLRLFVSFLALHSKLVHSSMDSSPLSTESGPKSCILDHGIGDKFYKCMQLSMNNHSIHGKKPSTNSHR